MNRHLGLYLQLFERTTDLFFTLIEKLFVCLRSHAMQIAQQMKKNGFSALVSAWCV